MNTVFHRVWTNQCIFMLNQQLRLGVSAGQVEGQQDWVRLLLLQTAARWRTSRAQQRKRPVTETQQKEIWTEEHQSFLHKKGQEPEKKIALKARDVCFTVRRVVRGPPWPFLFDLIQRRQYEQREKKICGVSPRVCVCVWRRDFKIG